MPESVLSLPYAAMLLLPAGLALLLSACTSLGYYSQSVSGQLEVMRQRQPIEELMEGKGTPPELKAKLQTVVEIRRFASDVLGLPDNRSYTSYADLGRPYAVWNVFAAPEFSLELKEWCFLIAGCVSYRGYFAESNARDYAESLRLQGYDTYVGGVSAYSTLGWFSDPVLNTVIGHSDARLAGLIFHELAHQQLYVPGDTGFNEGFAVTVELEGVKAWLRHRGDAGETADYAAALARRNGFFALVAATRERLLAVYTSDIGMVEKRRAKKDILTSMRSDYAAAGTARNGHDAYASWFAGELNNARLAAANTYREYVPLFRQLFRQSGGDFTAFYAAAAEVGRAPSGRWREALELKVARGHGDAASRAPLRSGRQVTDGR